MTFAALLVTQKREKKKKKKKKSILVNYTIKCNTMKKIGTHNKPVL